MHSSVAGVSADLLGMPLPLLYFIHFKILEKGENKQPL